MPSAAQPPVFLLDTMAFIFRAYHAMQRSRPMSNREGLPTAAIYVFVNMIKKLRQDFHPELFAAVFDLGGEVFRDEKARSMGPLKKWNGKTQSFDEVDYEGYKANREEMPDDLRRQIPYIRRALEALRIPILQAEGFEADDVIGTLALQAESAGHEVYIVSGDKDMMQLVTGQVRILNPQKDNLILDPAKVEEVLGLPPNRVIDYMALIGDTADNIPGAPGIGPKGALDLIRKYTTVEDVLDHASEVERKSYRESLEQNRDAVLLSKELVTIDCHVPLALDLEQMKTQEPDLEACRELFTELEFTTMLRDLTPAPTLQLAKTVEEPTPQQIEEFFTAAREHGFAFILDAAPAPVESSEIEPAQTMSLLDFAEAAEKSTEFFVGVCADPAIALKLSLNEELKALLEDEKIAKQTHDWKTALHTLVGQGVTLRGAVDDSMLLSYALNPTHSTQALADVAVRSGLPAPASLAAAAGCVCVLLPRLLVEVEKENLTTVYRDLDLPLVPVLFRMEQAGVRIDRAQLAALSEKFGAEMARVSSRIFELCGRQFNINSPKQLGEVLYTHLGLPAPAKSGKKALSTAQDILEHLSEEHEVPRLVLEFRHLSKLKSTYIDQLPQLADSDSRVHTTFQAALTATGRLSSTNPNLQNIPVRTELGREIRAAFVASPGTELLSADYSQIELRLLAHYSQDPLLLRAYEEDIDIHTLTASEVFDVPINQMDKETRSRAKAVNFGIVYGISAFGLAAQIGVPINVARDYIDRYFARYSGVAAFIERTLQTAREKGSVQTLFGRQRPIPDLVSRNPNQRGFAERTAVNSPLQGTAADLIKVAMISIDKKLTERNLKTRMVLQVHDELLFEVPEDEKKVVEKLVREEMEGAAKLSIPLAVDVAFGSNWKDL